MQLIGMLDSPYVRRVAVSLRLMGLDFVHRPVSVFRDFDEFQAVNPVVKAPTLVCADGGILMDSSLILDYASALPTVTRSLTPTDTSARRRVLSQVGLALAACEKTVQIVYERQLRPLEKQHEPWIERVHGQLLAAYRLLEADIVDQPPDLDRRRITQAGVTVAIAWDFTRLMLPQVVDDLRCPALRDLSAQAEALPEFAGLPSH